MTGGYNMYLDGLDKIDKKIIELLTENARMSYVDIAKEVGISRIAVKSRIDALEEKQIIEQYTIIVNPLKINNSVSSYLELEITAQHILEVIDILEKNDIVTKIYQLTGKNKLHVHTVASSQEEMDLFLKEVAYQLPGLQNLSCDVILSREKDIIGLKL